MYVKQKVSGSCQCICFIFVFRICIVLKEKIKCEFLHLICLHYFLIYPPYDILLLNTLLDLKLIWSLLLYFQQCVHNIKEYLSDHYIEVWVGACMRNSMLKA